MKDDDDDCAHATQVLRDCGDPLPAGTYVVILSGAGDEEGRIEVALSSADCGTVEANPQPTRIRLAQNSPNPFNPTTSIDFTLDQTGFVHLGVYDLLGREVAVLADGLLEAGSHVSQFDGSRLGSGVYIYTLQTEGSMVTRKMILTK